MKKPSLHIEAGAPIAEKVRILQDFLGEHYFDENGLMYSMWYWKGDELRPFRLEDFEGYSYPRSSEGWTPRGQNNNENSAWNSGIFLWSQCLRWEATRDEQALAYGAKAFRSIDHIFKLTEAAGHKGYLCKPYDGRVTKETSPDQYFAVMMGLWAYREMAPKEARERIDHLLPAMADWWRERKYNIKFFEMDMTGSDANDAHNLGHTAMHQMAYLITGDPKYLREAQRLTGLLSALPTFYDTSRARMLEKGTAYLEGYYDGYLYDPSRRDYVILDWESRSAIWMAAAPIPFFMRHDLGRASPLKHALYRIWKHMQYGLRDDLLSLYTIQVDLERDLWRPCHVPPTPERAANPPYYNWHFCSYYSEVCWGDQVGRIPHVCVMAHQYAPEFCPGALTLARTLLRKLDDQRLHWFIDPDGKQLLPPDRWMAHVLSSEIPAFTLLAYWTARANLLSLEPVG